jgi:hypothetical protein
MVRRLSKIKEHTMNEATATATNKIDHKELLLTNLTVTLHPHMGGVKEDGTVKLSWRERWERDEAPSMFYSVTGSAVVNGRTKRVSTSIPAVRDGVLCALGVEFADKSGNTRMLSEYQAPQSLKCHVKDGALVLEESLPVSGDGKECPAEYGLSFLVFAGSRKAIVLKDVQVTKDDISEKGTEYMDVRAQSGYEVVNIGVAMGGPLKSSDFALPKRAVTRQAARDTRAAAPATVDIVS